MPSDMIRIDGGRKLAQLAADVRRLGNDRTIVNNLGKRVRKLGTPLKKAIRKSALTTLPRRGGLNKWVAAANIRVQIIRSQRTAGIRLIVGRDSVHGRSDIRRIDAGTTRHPLFGNRKHWYPQTVTPGYVTTVARGEGGDMFQAEALAAVDEAIEEFARG